MKLRRIHHLYQEVPNYPLSNGAPNNNYAYGKAAQMKKPDGSQQHNGYINNNNKPQQQRYNGGKMMPKYEYLAQSKQHEGKPAQKYDAAANIVEEKPNNGQQQYPTVVEEQKVAFVFYLFQIDFDFSPLFI